MSIRVGIVGISGFGGGEAMRLVASHPSFELIYAAGEGSAGSRLVDRFPGVSAKLAELVIEKWDPVTLPMLDVLFASLPTGASAEALARVPEDVKIVDSMAGLYAPLRTLCRRPRGRLRTIRGERGSSSPSPAHLSEPLAGRERFREPAPSRLLEPAPSERSEHAPDAILSHDCVIIVRKSGPRR